MVQSPRNDPVPRRVGEVIGDPSPANDGPLGRICRTATELSRLQALMASYSDPDTSGHFQVANLRQDRLILLAPTASWATRLRMQAQRFLLALQTHGYGQVRHIDIRVAPLHHEADVERSRRPLSPAAELALDQMKRLTSDS